MLFGQDREELRRMYLTAWEKARAGRPMSALEAQIADVVAMHPEYHEALEAGALEHDYAPEAGATNPFLHMGLHLAVREQISTDRPPGIREIYARLEKRLGGSHDAEHRMCEVLAETLWQAQRDGVAPDERAYLEGIRRLL